MNVVTCLTEMETSSDVPPLVSEEGITCVVLLHKIDSKRLLQHTQVPPRDSPCRVCCAVIAVMLVEPR